MMVSCVCVLLSCLAVLASSSSSNPAATVDSLKASSYVTLAAATEEELVKELNDRINSRRSQESAVRQLEDSASDIYEEINYEYDSSSFYESTTLAEEASSSTCGGFVAARELQAECQASYDGELPTGGQRSYFTPYSVTRTYTSDGLVFTWTTPNDSIEMQAPEVVIASPSGTISAVGTASVLSDDDYAQHEVTVSSEELVAGESYCFTVGTDYYAWSEIDGFFYDPTEASLDMALCIDDDTVDLEALKWAHATMYEQGYSFVGYTDSTSDEDAAAESVLEMWSASLSNLCAGTVSCDLFQNTYGSHCYASFDTIDSDAECDNALASFTNNQWFTDDVGVWHFVEVDSDEVSDPFTQLPANVKWLQEEGYAQMIMYKKCDLPCPAITSSLSVNTISKPANAPANLTVVSSDTESASVVVFVDEDTDKDEITGFKLYVDGVRWPTYSVVDENGMGSFELTQLAFGQRTYELTASYFTCSGEGPQSEEIDL